MKRPAWMKAWRVAGVGKTQGKAPVLLKTGSIWSRLSGGLGRGMEEWCISMRYVHVVCAVMWMRDIRPWWGLAPGHSPVGFTNRTAL